MSRKTACGIRFGQTVRDQSPVLSSLMDNFQIRDCVTRMPGWELSLAWLEMLQDAAGQLLTAMTGWTYRGRPVTTRLAGCATV